MQLTEEAHAYDVGTGDDLYRSTQACRMTGVTYRKLDYWCRTGLVKPAYEADGQGTQRLFDADGIRDLWLIERLAGMGVSFEAIREHGPADAARLLYAGLRTVLDEVDG